MFTKIAARDGVLLAIVAALWVGAAPLSAGDGFLADLSGLIVGLGFGLATFLLHEWGHLLGGLAAGASFIAPQSLRSAYLFSFDTKANARGPFLAMSFGGFVVTGVALAVAYQWMPGDWLATRVARGAVVFLASLTVFLEFPLVVWSLIRYDALPSIEVFETEAAEDPAAR